MRLSMTAKEKGTDRGGGGARRKGWRLKGWKREVKMRKSVSLKEDRRRCGQGSFLNGLRQNAEQRGEFPWPPVQLIP